MNNSKGKTVLVLVIILAALAGTHWFAYRQGREAVREEFKVFYQESDSKQAAVPLRADVHALRAVTKNPDAFSKDELGGFRTTTEANIDSVEKVTIPYVRKTGNLQKEQQLERLVKEARELLAKLPPG